MSTITPATGCNHPRNTPWRPERVVVLGIGNLLWADEGFGVRCVEAFQQRFDVPPHVELIDGGTQGLYLIHTVQSADALIIFDAIDYGLEPGTLRVLANDEVPHFMGAKKMSLHQTGFQEVLHVARFTGNYPQELRLIGCQPEMLEDYGGSLTACVKQAMEQALLTASDLLREWGVGIQPRQTPLSPVETLNAEFLSMARYELERPDEAQACRVGDQRFFPDGSTAQGMR